ncbi:MAG: chemotaxis-specific protein-glutamate methyltransferase CheB [Clostridia bacterium]|nr:chemotaxis-specific protein-glutamate methyltransferase CheB [Clostridia bacterium]
MKKKILIIDDSALMRRVICDIISSDDRFEVVDTAHDGVEGFNLICRNHYDAIVLDIYMPRMTGLELLMEMQKSRISANVLVASTTTKEGARETMLALEYGALEFIQKPESVLETKSDTFKSRFLQLLEVVAGVDQRKPVLPREEVKPVTPMIRKSTTPVSVSGKKLIAIASSTGGPKALQDVIPRLPEGIMAPILLVQHMPKGFTKSLAERLNELSTVPVKEYVDGEELLAGHVYVAQGGKHMKAVYRGAKVCVVSSDEPAREGVKPCANYMYESLRDCPYDEIICVVLTGMGSDGTAGIKSLREKKRVRIIAQNEETCAVYGMPKSIVATGYADSVVPIDAVAEEIIKNVGVR